MVLVSYKPNWLQVNWLQVFKRVHSALLGSGGGLEQRTSLVPSEKCVGGWDSDNDDMRMSAASFARAIARFASDLCLHFLPLFQQVAAIRKTCNQLSVKTPKIGIDFKGSARPVVDTLFDHFCCARPCKSIGLLR